MTEDNLTIGCTVRLSEYGRDKLMRKYTTGVVTGFSRQSVYLIHVHWKGLKKSHLIAKSFIERLDE